MWIKVDIDLKNFDFWCGAKDNRKKFTDKEMDELQEVMEEFYRDGITPTETDINDMMWFEPENLAGWIGKEWDD